MPLQTIPEDEVPATFTTTPDPFTRRKHLQHLISRETHVHEGLALSMTLRAEELHQRERELKPLDAALQELEYIEESQPLMLAGLRKQRQGLVERIQELNKNLREMHQERKKVQKDLEAWRKEMRGLEKVVFEEEIEDVGERKE